MALIRHGNIAPAVRIFYIRPHGRGRRGYLVGWFASEPTRRTAHQPPQI